MTASDLSDWRLPEIAGLVLAILALLVGGYHIFEIRRATRDVRSVQGALSTRYLGNFPFFLDKIVELIRSAQIEIVMFCDFPGYADFSNPSGALTYRFELERQRQRGVKVELTCMDSDGRTKYLNEQFSASEWSEWSKDPKKHAKVLKFLESRGGVSTEGKNREELLATMETADRQLLEQVFLGKALEIPGPMPIYFWIVDRRNAIFTIPTLSDEAVEYGFATSDHALIKALLELRKRYRKASSSKA